MIRTSIQLKAKVRNLAQGNGNKAQTLIRSYVMEHFLERVSLSEHRDNFILKGGMLVAALVGLDARATMDIDATIRSATLSQAEVARIAGDIVAVEIDDGVTSMHGTRISRALWLARTIRRPLLSTPETDALWYTSSMTDA